MVEKQREKDLGKVVTGGGEGTEAEGTEKANHRGHGGHGEKQTTEGTEVGREGAERLVRTLGKVRLQGGQWVGRARKKQTTEDTENTEKKSKPQRAQRTRRKQTTEDTEVEKRGRTRWSAPTKHGIGWRRGRWVKGTKADWKAGRRLEGLPHNSCLPHKSSVFHETRPQAGKPAPQ